MQHGGLGPSTSHVHHFDAAISFDDTPNQALGDNNEHTLSITQQSDGFLGIGEWATTTTDRPTEQDLPAICPYHANLLQSLAQAHGSYAGLAQVQRFLIEQPLFIVRHLDRDALAAFMGCTYCANVREKIQF